MKFYLRHDLYGITQVFGNTMYLTKPSFVSSNLVKNGIHEKLETEYIFRTIKNGNVVVDLGANIGYFTLIFAKLVGIEGQVIAFEPELSNFKILQKNIKKNHYKNTIAENLAISNKILEAKLFLSKTNTGSHRMYKSKTEDLFTTDGFLKNPIKTTLEYQKLLEYEKQRILPRNLRRAPSFIIKKIIKKLKR